VPPLFPPSQTFQFGSLEFITDRLGALRLHEEEAALAASKESAPPPKLLKLKRRRSIRRRIRKRKPSQPTRAVLCRIALMMASNPTAEDINLVLYSLANVSRQLTGGPPLQPPCSFSEQLPYGLHNSAGTYARETRKIMHGHQPTTQFVRMAGSYPTTVHDLLCYKDPLSYSSSTGDNYLEGASMPRRVCAMAAAPSEPPPEVVPSQETHAPQDHCPQVLADALSPALAHAPAGGPTPAASHWVEGSKSHRIRATTCAGGQPRHHQRRPHATPTRVPRRLEHRRSGNHSTDIAGAARPGAEGPSPPG
jgi:hypothetical protein